MATLVDQYERPVRAHRPAEMGRRMHGTYPTSRNATSVNLSDGRRLEQIIHDQTRNFPLVESWLSSWVAHTVGTGIWPALAHPNREYRRNFRQWMRRWNQQADADGMTTFQGMTALISRKVCQDGEVFARLRFRRTEDGLATPLQIQLLRAAQLPRDKTQALAGQNRIVGGIEFDAIGRRVAYHFYHTDPGDVSTSNRLATLDTVRIPAEQILHIGMPQDVGEIRHVSILRSALMMLKSMSDVNENTVERLRILSLFTALYSVPLDATDQEARDRADAMNFNLEPGMISEVYPGSTFSQLETPDALVRPNGNSCSAGCGKHVSRFSSHANAKYCGDARSGLFRLFG